MSLPTPPALYYLRLREARMISVVACVKNRAHNVKKWLESLALQTVDIQTILFDYGSDEGLDKVLEDSPIAVGYVPVEDLGIDKFPEAYLKNVGIRHANEDIIACTNVDVCYEPEFFEKLARKLDKHTLVMAMRKNAPQDTDVPVDVEGWGRDRKGQDGKPAWSVTIVWGPDTGLPIIAAADLQMLHRADWYGLQGYDEEITGWGSLDSDLTMRCRLYGMNLHIAGMDYATYVHEWHESYPEVHLQDAARNHPIIMDKINSGSVRRNGKTWGGSDA